MSFLSIFLLEITSDLVGKYLKHHPEFLEHFLIENVGLEELQKWVIRRLGGRKEIESNNDNKNVDKYKLLEVKLLFLFVLRNSLSE